MNLFNKVRETAYFICAKTIEWSLIFIIAVLPLIINPKEFDFWYCPKMESVYVLLIIAGIALLLKALFKGRSFLWERNPLTVVFIFSVVSVSPTFWSLMGLTIAKGRLEHSETI